MILDTLELHNFRQYYGTQRIVFSKDRHRNVTVIHGENGSGKTTLLGALNWVLYGKSGLPDPEDIICERAVAEAPEGAELEAYVSLTFTDDAKTYFVKRSVRARKTGGKLEYSAPRVELEYINEAGEHVVPKFPQEVIDQILPPGLRGYFFFDGERIDNLTKKDGAKEIKRAIKILMGLEVLERAGNHLKGVQQRFLEEYGKYADDETQRIVEQLKVVEEEIEAKKVELEDEKNNRSAIEAELQAVADRLRSLEASRDIQEKKEELQRQLKQYQEAYQEVQKKLRYTASRRGYLAFCGSLIRRAKEFVSEKRAKGEIPSGIKERFVKDLLQLGRCICGTPLPEGSEARAQVSSWLTRAGKQAVEDAVHELDKDLVALENARAEMFRDLRELCAQRQHIKTKLRELAEEIGQLEAQLEGKDVEEIAALQRKEHELRIKRFEIERKIGAIEKEIEQLQERHRQLDNERRKKEAENEKARLALRRMEACQRIRDVVQKILELRAQSVQDDLQRRMTEVYNRMLRKGYEAVIDEDYQLMVYKPMGESKVPVRMSQGERQVTSLAFIGALVDIAREQYEREHERSGFFRGGYYPIVMDSPFGYMDQDHRERTARNLPTLAHQVVVLVSSSQWEGSVKDGMQQYVGKEYVLQYRSPKLDPSVKFEYTEVQEVRHA